jgi:hypothetical protein
MTEFRKHKSGRQYARIEGCKVLRVMTMFVRTEIVKDESVILSHAITEDKEDYFPCTEQEFKEAYEEALRRIQNMEI